MLHARTSGRREILKVVSEGDVLDIGNVLETGLVRLSGLCLESVLSAVLAHVPKTEEIRNDAVNGHASRQ